MTDNYDIIQAITESVQGLTKLRDVLIRNPNAPGKNTREVTSVPEDDFLTLPPGYDIDVGPTRDEIATARGLTDTIAVLRRWHERLEAEMGEG